MNKKIAFAFLFALVGLHHFLYSQSSSVRETLPKEKISKATFDADKRVAAAERNLSEYTKRYQEHVGVDTTIIYKEVFIEWCTEEKKRYKKWEAYYHRLQNDTIKAINGSDSVRRIIETYWVTKMQDCN